MGALDILREAESVRLPRTSPFPARQGASQLYQNIAGFLGAEPYTSVMDPDYATKKAAYEAGEKANLVSSALDAVSGLGALKGGLAALKGLGGLGAGLVGSIRRGGRSDLLALHQSPLSLLAGEKAPRELYSPSVAINRNNVTQDFGDFSGTIDFIARPDVFDPVRSGGQLHVRDIYSPRREDYLGRPIEEAASRFAALKEGSPLRRDVARRRLMDRFYPPEQRFGEMNPGPETKKYYTYSPEKLAQLKSLFEMDPYQARDVLLNMPGMDPSHWLAVQQSKPFSSFRHFENDPRGAALLGASKEDVLSYGKALDKLIEDEGVLPDMRMYAANAPSEYGELKLTGGVPLSSDYWAGAVIRPSVNYQEDIGNAISHLTERGIPYYLDVAPGALGRVFPVGKKLQEGFGSRGMTPKVEKFMSILSKKPPRPVYDDDLSI